MIFCLFHNNFKKFNFFLFSTQDNIVETLYFLIPFVFIVLLVLPICVEVRASYNPLFNKGVVALFILKKKIFYYVFAFHGKYVELQNETETKLQKLEFSSEKFAVMEEFGRQLKDKIKLKKGYMYYNIGTGDAFGTALLCGVLNQIVTQFFVFVKSKKPTASLCVFDTASYNKLQCEIAVLVQASVSFFDVAYSFIHSVIITKRK